MTFCLLISVYWMNQCEWEVNNNYFSLYKARINAYYERMSDLLTTVNWQCICYIFMYSILFIYLLFFDDVTEMYDHIPYVDAQPRIISNKIEKIENWQVCVIKTVEYRHTHARTDKKVKPEGPMIMQMIYFTLRLWWSLAVQPLCQC